MGSKRDRLLIDLRKAFESARNDADASAMQRYMKSQMPFYGLQANTRRKLQNGVFRHHAIDSTDQLIDVASTLWNEAKHREERYAAIDLPAFRDYRRFETLQCIPTYETWIRTGAWWDFCDDISGNRIKSMLIKHPEQIKPLLLRWAHDKNFWLRRASIICQRTMAGSTDATLLYACILPSVDSQEFFLRKGIGWALRARSYDAPQEVLAFVKEYDARLSPLTKREALKVLTKRGVTAKSI